MKVILKEPYEAQQFNPRNNVPSRVLDLLREPAHLLLISKGYEWGIQFDDGVTRGININDWIVTYGDNVFIYTNEQFRRDFKEVTE